MIQIGDTLVSLDLIERYFCCDLALCKGACCVEGDAGAPLEKEELETLKRIVPVVWDYLSAKAKKIINRQGIGYMDSENEMVTSLVNGRDCVFTCYEVNGICRCAIEKAYREGRTDFVKPASCRLYPVRVKRYKDYQAVNYHRYKVCCNAETNGKQKGMRLYQFLREPLTCKFGKEWYDALDLCAKEFLA